MPGNLLEQSCPIPKSDYEHILLAHGGGGKLTQQLIDKIFYPLLGNEILVRAHDGATLTTSGAKLAFTTDSFVVDPIFFPGGNIGDLALNGTVNDLVCCGAIPKFISLAFILEEGLLIEDLWEIVKSIRQAADKSGVKVVTGDTKVVGKGKGDRIFINTSGIGEVIEGTDIGPGRCAPGDVILINGSIADHGISIMSKREGLSFETDIESDTASLNGMITEVLNKYKSIHVLRDPTRGGLASALNEISHSSKTGITLYEDKIGINESVRGACEIMGFDPLYIANEGKILIILPEKDAPGVLDILRSHKEGKEAAIIGCVTAEDPGFVKLKTTIGSSRIVDMMTGEQLPRIC
ncbi:MAG: hydrogenase expression/formation protein HypE [Bacteroidota bacterium]